MPYHRLTRTGIVIGAALAAAPAATQTATPAPAPPPPACTAPEHRQFDFWVGSWEVHRGDTNALVARSLIEKLYDGCVIRENWMPLRGSAGGSVNNYVTEEKRWHQTWVSGANARVEFQGGLVGDKMVLMGFWKDVAGPGKHGLIRMTYSPLADGAVRQFGEISQDHGLSWAPAFDFTYRKPKPS